MEYRVFGETVVLRIDRGEEILETIAAVCEKEQIQLGTVSGLGAVDKVSLGVFNREKFIYEHRSFQGDWEIAACSGNISTMEGKIYLHLHMVVGNVTEGKSHSGHLSSGRVSLTGEFFIHKIEGAVGRAYSPEVGLNLMQFTEPGKYATSWTIKKKRLLPVIFYETCYQLLALLTEQVR